MSDFLRDFANSKKYPDFKAQTKELALQSAYAAKMRDEGRLSRSENAEVEADICRQHIENLPMEEYVAMRKDGRLEQWEAVASHDGSRCYSDVLADRAALEQKLKYDAADEAWLNQAIDSKRYAEMINGLRPSDGLAGQIGKGDYDGAASEAFASRHGDVDQPDPTDEKRFTDKDGVLDLEAMRQAQPGQYVGGDQRDTPAGDGAAE